MFKNSRYYRQINSTGCWKGFPRLAGCGGAAVSSFPVPRSPPPPRWLRLCPANTRAHTHVCVYRCQDKSERKTDRRLVANPAPPAAARCCSQGTTSPLHQLEPGNFWGLCASLLAVCQGENAPLGRGKWVRSPRWALLPSATQPQSHTSEPEPAAGRRLCPSCPRLCLVLYFSISRSVGCAG